jgi:hypothetical protein
MDLESLIEKANPNVIIFLLTTLIAFISWLIKSLVENPITESKNTFNKFAERRIEILTEVKTKLNFIAYFPTEEESKDYKNQLQQIFLNDGKSGYLNKNTFEAALKISIEPIVDEKLLLKTIKEIDDDLYLTISKIHQEISFYRKFSNYDPFKRFIGYSLLSLQYIFSLSIITLVLTMTVVLFIKTSYWCQFLILVIFIIAVYLINKWFSK